MPTKLSPHQTFLLYGIVIVPANCTNQLQPLDLSINKAAKEFLHGKFQERYALQIFEQWKSIAESKPIDLRLNIMKPLGVSWMVNLYDHIKSRPNMIKGAFTAAGIEKWEL